MTILSKKSKTIFSALLIASLMACGCGGSGASAGAAASSETEAAGSKSAAVSAAEAEEAASVAATSTDSGTVTSVSSSSEETLEETLDLTGKTIVACVGDSITWGFGPGGQVENNYPVVLGELLGDDYAVLNYGNPGTTLQDECKRPYTGQAEYQESLDVNADIYIFMLGTNDSMEENWDAARFEKEFGEKLDTYLALESHPTVYVMTSPQSYAKEDTGEVSNGIRTEIVNDEIVPIQKKIAEEKGLTVIDLNAYTVDHPDWFSDGVHPTEEGYRILAEFVCSSIQG